MICPYCNQANFPGNDYCDHCQQTLMVFDVPRGDDRLQAALLHEPISRLCPKKPETVLADASLLSALNIMCAKEIGALLVVDRYAHLVGIITERDYLERVIDNNLQLSEQLVSSVMTANPETVSPTHSLALALQKMDIGGYRHLPVVEEDLHPVGIISVRDIIRFTMQISEGSETI